MLQRGLHKDKQSKLTQQLCKNSKSVPFSSVSHFKGLPDEAFEALQLLQYIYLANNKVSVFGERAGFALIFTGFAMQTTRSHDATKFCQE